MANTYDVGDRVKITGTFKQDDVVGDPAIIRFLYKDPSGTTVTRIYPDGITREEEGIYSSEILCSASGFWHYRMDDGGNNVASENQFQVKVSNLI